MQKLTNKTKLMIHKLKVRHNAYQEAMAAENYRGACMWGAMAIEVQDMLDGIEFLEPKNTIRRLRNVCPDYWNVFFDHETLARHAPQYLPKFDS